MRPAGDRHQRSKTYSVGHRPWSRPADRQAPSRLVLGLPEQGGGRHGPHQAATGPRTCSCARPGRPRACRRWPTRRPGASVTTDQPPPPARDALDAERILGRYTGPTARDRSSVASQDVVVFRREVGRVLRPADRRQLGGEQEDRRPPPRAAPGHRVRGARTIPSSRLGRWDTSRCLLDTSACGERFTTPSRVTTAPTSAKVDDPSPRPRGPARGPGTTPSALGRRPGRGSTGWARSPG